MNIIPKISIVLPTYNGAAYVLQSISSCLNQTYKNIELIVVDDGSTDDTASIVRTIRDPRLYYLRNTHNMGLPRSLNSGFSGTTGEFLTWTSDDNFYALDALEKMAKFLFHHNLSFVYSNYYTFVGDDYLNAMLTRLPDEVDLSRGNHIGACFLYTRAVADAVGRYDPETEMAEDYDYWLRVSQSFTLGHLAEPIYFYRLHETSLTSTRLYEIKIVDVLVRMKNRIITADVGANILLDAFSIKYPGKQRLNRFILKLLKQRSITQTLQDYGEQRLTLSQTKAALSGTLCLDK